MTRSLVWGSPRYERDRSSSALAVEIAEFTRRLVRNASQPIKAVIARPTTHDIQENEPIKADMVSP
ncbi:hypothetical protein, partial [Frigoribacterium sp. UYMn621]|uniref:hypothetical protein n=1 Tax=Frigoribacterium sp. UYMn621 TaxID=3156343 RepID=UPI00339A101F